MGGYLALYRKYRPNNFNDLVGQSGVSTIIKNEILNNKISHAYLFSGPRGTGKTSTAKIIAKMINCSNLGADGTPCEKCASCLNFNSSSDIVEIDAASNNGVDEIRDLRDKVNLVPTIGKYKIYIIDEVHMLTVQAFNALLKTLEEPPAHVVFILATTEFYKIPATVVSRCQKFQFLKFSDDEIVSRLSNISSLENIDVSKDILYEIARLADGGLRDAINMLDQLSSFGNGKINIDDLYKLNGVVSYVEISNLLKFVKNNNIVDIASFINEIDRSGKNIDRFINDLLIFLKDVLLYKNEFNLSDLGIKDKQEKIIEISKIFDLDEISNMIFSLNDLNNKLKKSVFSTVLLTVYFVKLSNDLNNNNLKIGNRVDNLTDMDVNNSAKETNNNFSISKNNIVSSITKFSDKLKKIRINNSFSTASKLNKDEFVKKWDTINQSSILDDFSSIAGIIDDIDILVVGDNNVIFLAKYDSLLERIYNYVDDFERLLYLFFNKKYKIVFLANDEWIYEKNNYIKNIKSGKKYIYINEDENGDDNIDVNKKVETNDDIDKIVSILGEDIISYK